MHFLRLNHIFNDILISNPLFVNFYSIENFVFIAKNPCSVSDDNDVDIHTSSSTIDTSDISNENTAPATFTVTVVPTTEYVPIVPSFDANDGLYSS